MARKQFSKGVHKIGATTPLTSINTEQLFNDEEPNIDISEPLWVGLTDGIIHLDRIYNTNGMNVTTTGSGSTSSAFYGLTLKTGATSGSTTQVQKLYSTALVSPSFDKKSVMRTKIEIYDSNTGRIDYIGVGRISSGISGYGFKIASGDLLGAVQDGGSETTTTLISGVSVNKHSLKTVLYPGSKVEFFVDGIKEGEITSGLPTGTTSRVMDLYVENTVAAQRRLLVNLWRYVQNP